MHNITRIAIVASALAAIVSAGTAQAQGGYSSVGGIPGAPRTAYGRLQSQAPAGANRSTAMPAAVRSKVAYYRGYGGPSSMEAKVNCSDSALTIGGVQSPGRGLTTSTTVVGDVIQMGGGAYCPGRKAS